MKKLIMGCLFLISGPVFSQLSGTYTIGGSSPDFPDFISAYYALDSQNTSDTVEFLMRPGTYYGDLHDNSFYTNHPVTFRSETGLNDVVISDSTVSYAIESTWSYTKPRKLFTFKHLTFDNALNFSAAEALHLVRFSYLIDSCIFNNSLYLDRESGTPTAILRNSTVNSPYYVSLGGGTAYNNVFNTAEVRQKTGGGPLYYYNNISHGYLNIAAGDFYNNEILGGVGAAHGGGLRLINNNIYPGYTGDALGIAFGNTIKIFGNKIYGKSNLSYVVNVELSNNYFFRPVDLSFDGQYRLFNNNFADSAYVETWVAAVIAKNNLFSAGIMRTDGSLVLQNNNYHHTVTVLPPSYFCNYEDTHPFNYDPHYISQQELIPTNAALIGKGMNVVTVTHDMDSISRPLFPTLGAHEICFSESGIDTIYTMCGDSIPLIMCQLPPGGNYTWSPASGLDDPFAYEPIAAPATNTTYVVYDSISGFLDSVHVVVTPYNNSLSATAYTQCGKSVPLTTPYHDDATYLWQPSYGLSDSTSYHVIAQPLTTTEYYLTVIIPGCGTYYDSILVNINPIPTANFSISDIDTLTVTFYDLSLCADSIHWDFGDGTFGTDSIMIHTFDSTGMYLVCLEAINSYGSTFQCYNIFVASGVGIAENDVDLFQLFPNPNNGHFYIRTESDLADETKFMITDISGRIVYQNQINEMHSNEPTLINPGILPAGIYFLQLVHPSKTQAIRFVVTQ